MRQVAKNTTTTEGFRWEPRTATRIWLSAALVSAAVGILFAVLQAQGWTVPKPLGLAVVALVGLVIVAATAVFVYEIIRALRRFREHRLTTPSWVESEPPGLLDYEVDGIRAMERFNKELIKLNKRTTRLNKKVVRHTKRMERAVNRSSQTKRRIANRPAKHMMKNGIYIEKRAELFRGLVRDIHRNYEGFISALTLQTDDDIRVATPWRDTLASTQQETGGAIEANIGYRDSVRDLQKQNPSRAMRLACKQLADGLDDVVVVLKQYEKRSGELLRIFNQKLGGR